MTSSIKTMLIIGATSGIGEAFARRFHAAGKKLILTGRREDRLQKLQAELPGTEYRVFDNGDLASLPATVNEIMKSFPDLNTVWINSGIMNKYTVADGASVTNEAIEQEVRVNVTAPMILSRLFIPHLISLGSVANLMFTSSGLGFAPAMFPTYCGTKAAMHSFSVVARQQLKDTKVNVWELVPPYVATDIDVGYRDQMPMKPMPLDEFTNTAFEVLDKTDAKDIKEIAAGTAVARVGLWRGSIGKWLLDAGIGG